LIDCIARMVDGVLSDEVCFTDESHYSGLLEYPQYTRPAVWEGRQVPEILLSGHHANIEEWRRMQSIERTFRRRPELLEKADLSKKEKLFVQSLEKMED
ncbi:MAG: tRNA (guanosine(37)-N1)-methyltransferase TrmD, partial [Oscillospiraceae bacterium]|nr:tRNA (guanosine(37)-N1)-methyltransferase TrmD [Oscillospiraceae bacterium]